MNNQKMAELLKKSVFTFFDNAAGDFEVEHAAITYKNFSGKPTDMNPAGGKRTFVLCLPEDVGEHLRDLGWNIKISTPNVEGDPVVLYTEIVINMDSDWPPTVELLTQFNGNTTATRLTGDEVSRLDKVWIENVDIRIHPYRHGRAPYIYKGYVNDIRVTQAQGGTHFGGKYDKYETA